MGDAADQSEGRLVVGIDGAAGITDGFVTRANPSGSPHMVLVLPAQNMQLVLEAEREAPLESVLLQKHWLPYATPAIPNPGLMR